MTIGLIIQWLEEAAERISIDERREAIRLALDKSIS